MTPNRPWVARGVATVGNFSRICDLDFERPGDRRFLDWKAVLAEATDEAGFRLG